MTISQNGAWHSALYATRTMPAASGIPESLRVVLRAEAALVGINFEEPAPFALRIRMTVRVPCAENGAELEFYSGAAVLHRVTLYSSSPQTIEFVLLEKIRHFVKPVPFLMVARSLLPKRDCEPVGTPIVDAISVRADAVTVNYAGDLIRLAQSIASVTFVAANTWQALEDRLQDAKRRRSPFSLIRFGDGEGRVLGFDSIMRYEEMSYQLILYHFGAKALVGSRDLFGPAHYRGLLGFLRDRLLDAARSADIVGIPSPREISDDPNRSRGALGFACATLCLAREMDRRDPATIYSTFVNHAMNEKGILSRLLEGEDEIGLISHTDASSLLTKHFGIGSVKHYQIPGHASFSTIEKPHFPNAMMELITTIKVPTPGYIYFVAAGLLGKLYCDIIKQRGGIAIDLGGVFDGWTGIGRAELVRREAMRLAPDGH